MKAEFAPNAILTPGPFFSIYRMKCHFYLDFRDSYRLVRAEIARPLCGEPGQWGLTRHIDPAFFGPLPPENFIPVFALPDPANRLGRSGLCKPFGITVSWQI